MSYFGLVLRRKFLRLLSYNIFSDTTGLANREYLHPYGFPFSELNVARNINLNYIVRTRSSKNPLSFPGLRGVMSGIRGLFEKYSEDPDSAGLVDNYKHQTLLKLRRYRTCPRYILLKRQDGSEVNCPLTFDPFNLPLNFHAYWISCLRCETIRDTTLNILKAVVSLIYVYRTQVAYSKRHDFVRQCLAILDKQAFLWSNEEATSSVGSLLHGLSNMGGPRGWVKEELISRCHEWIQGETTLGSDPEVQSNIKARMSTWIDSWVAQHPSNLLSFEEFVTDPMKWGTSGGAPAKRIASETGHEVIRSKWAWGLSNLSEGKDVYREARAVNQVCSVALKEEAKTRLVITTPVDSYLRQAYIWYALGKPKFLQSTLTDPELLNRMTTTAIDQYICIDSSKFDYNVPDWFFTHFYIAMRTAYHRMKHVRSSIMQLLP